ncbi:MAG: TIGR01841 family phasin, partial [Holosporaceae bacterium]|nr:TIGR01841 family phasin [Holosporaceae bacterium]
MATATNPGTDAKKDNLGGFKIPQIDTGAILDSYKKNLEILGLINKMSTEVCNGVVKLQSAFIKQFATDMGGVMEKSAKPSEAFAKFSQVTRDAVVKAIGNSKQISDLITANNNELTALVAKRFKESVEEAKHVV